MKSLQHTTQRPSLQIHFHKTDHSGNLLTLTYKLLELPDFILALLSLIAYINVLESVVVAWNNNPSTLLIIAKLIPIILTAVAWGLPRLNVQKFTRGG